MFLMFIQSSQISQHMSSIDAARTMDTFLPQVVQKGWELHDLLSMVIPHLAEVAS